MSRRVTPTGVLLLPSTATREAWLAERKNGIGASDLSAIVGMSQYGNAMNVWADKTGRLPADPMGEAATWGIRSEDMVAKGWAEDHGYRVTRLGMIAHQVHPWRRASLDRRVHGCDRGPCAVQIKTRTAWMREEWNDGAVPDRITAQVQWELHVSGYDHSHLAVLIGGNQLVDRVIDEDLDVQTYLIAEAERVWECVQADTPPEVEPEGAMVGLYQRMYPEREGAVELGPDAKRWLDDYRLLGVKGSEAEKTRKAAQAALLGLLGAGEVGLLDGVPVFTYHASKGRTTCDLDALKANFPEAYAATVTTAAQGSRSFRLTKEAS